MAERKVIHKGNIGNALHSVAPDHITATADEIFDEKRQEYQEDINEGVGRYIDNPEFIKVELDSNNRIVRAIKADGTEYLGVGVEVHGDIITDGANITVIDNPEFSAVWLNKKDKILFGIQNDGNFFFGAGVPKQVVDYVEKTLKMQLDGKVDKEENKSLINKDFADNVDYIDNPEFKEIKLDDNGNIVEAIYKDGKKLLGAGLKAKGDIDLDGLITTCIQNPEFVAACTVGNKLVFGINIDGNFYFGAGVPKQIQKYFNDIYGYYEENPEYLKVYLDHNGKIIKATKRNGITLFGAGYEVDGNVTTVINTPEFVRVYFDTKDRIVFALKNNGDVLFGCGVPTQIKRYIETILKPIKEAVGIYEDNPEYLEIELDSIGRLLSGRNLDGTAFEKVGFSTPKLSISGNTTENIKDAEDRLEIKTDGEKKIISYRKKDGTKVEKVGLETPVLKVDKLYVGGKDIALQTVTTETIYVSKPKYGEFRFYGEMPTDMSDDRIPTTPEVIFSVDGRDIFKANTELSIQGHGSANYAKKGYTLDFKNADGEELSVKFGDMAAVDSFHLKAYITDRTHARDVASARYWRDMIRQLGSPFDKVNNIPYNIAANQKRDAIFISDANYCINGFPVGVYVNDEFYGLYTIKHKKSRQNYGMEKSIKTEIFLDSINGAAALESTFDASGWDLKNPKLKNYEEGDPITDAGVLANCERLFNFTSDIVNQKANVNDYLVLPHWVVFNIFIELIGHYDTNHNNIELATWDGTHWSILIYDVDLTMGLNAWNDYNIETGKDGMYATATFFNTFRNIFETEIKQTYTKLRKSGFISTQTMYKYYTDQVNCIPRDIQEADRTKWANIWNNGYPTIEQIYKFIETRIEYLDSIWLIND